MKRTLLLFALLACACPQVQGGSIPPELVGTWAPASSKMDGGVLLEGYAIYLNTNGLAAVVAAPPPIGAKWHATYEATNHVLTMSIAAQPSEGLTQAMTNRFVYDPKAKTLTATNSSTKEILRRHGDRIPGGVIEDFK
jgi:hypothetical protein